jgi:hypothetical protein
MRVSFIAALLIAMALPANMAAAIEIVSPAQNSRVTPGQLLTITIAPSAGQTIGNATVILSTGEQVKATKSGGSGTFQASVRVPYDAVCAEFMSVITDAQGSGGIFKMLELYVDPGQPTELTLIAPSTMTIKGKLAEAMVRGVFPDGRSRDLSDPECGTVFSVNNQNIIVSDPSGILQPVGNGTATLSVSSWGLQATKEIEVALSIDTISNQIPIAVASDITTTRETSIYLDATQSSDPEGDNLFYEWRQIGGRIVILEVPNTAKPFFLTPYVDQETVLTFSLIVTDAKNASSMPKLVKVTVQPVTPVPPQTP